MKMKGNLTRIAAIAIVIALGIGFVSASQEPAPATPGVEAALASTYIDPANSYFGYGFEPYVRFSITPAADALVPALDANSIYSHPLINFSFETHYKNGSVQQHTMLKNFRWEQLQDVTREVTRYSSTPTTLPNGTQEYVTSSYAETVVQPEWVAVSDGPFGKAFTAEREYEYRLVAPADALDFDNILLVKWTACVVNKCLDPQWTTYAEVSRLYTNWSSTQNNPWQFQYFQGNGTRVNMTYAATCAAHGGELGACWYSSESDQARFVQTDPSSAQNVTITTGAGGGVAFPNEAVKYYFTKHGNYTVNGTFWCRGGAFCNSGNGMNYTVYLNTTQKCSGSITGGGSAITFNCDLGTDIGSGSYLDVTLGSNADSFYDYANMSLTVYGAFVTTVSGYLNSSMQVNQTDAGKATKFTMLLMDSAGLSTYIAALDNGNGTFVNSTPILITGTSNQTAFNYTINSTVGSLIRWYVWFNNTAGNGNSTGYAAQDPLAANLSAGWSATNGNPWFYQYFKSNGTHVNMTQTCAGAGGGSNHQCWQSGETSQTLTSLYPTTYNLSIGTGSASDQPFPNLAFLYYFTQGDGYLLNGTAWCYGGSFCGGGDGMNWTAYINGSSGVQKCNGSITGSGGANAINCTLGTNLPAGAFLEFDVGSNSGSTYDYGNLSISVWRTGTGEGAYSFRTTQAYDVVFQPMSVWGYFTGAGSASVANVTAYIDGVQKSFFNMTTTGQYGLFDVQGNGTDYGRALWLYVDNDTARNVSTAFTPGRTERLDLAT